MRLKSLELQGFKSFQDKTLVRFDETLTGIVGPNGCGKSNIVDAIRWVMGEQSAKNLRGKSMDEVIFAGSQNREPSAVASVELTFSTQGGNLPPSYMGQPEVSICRKLYRTGESEYYINRQVARLRDITDLFLGTGLGVRAYSIIAQGQVDRVVSLKPEERRSLVEEAAGISKFKMRKEAALRKMEATGQNLLRLTDILSEISRQLESLERQSRKAVKYKEIHDEWFVLDRQIASLEYDRFAQSQSEQIEFLRENDAREVALRNELQQLENEIEVEKSTLMEMESEVSIKQETLYQTDNRLRLAEAKLSQRRETILRQERDLENRAESARELVEELSGCETGLMQINEQKVFSDLEFVDLEEQLAVLEGRHQDLEGTSREVFSTLESARLELAQTGSRLTQIETQIQSLKERSEELQTKKSTDEQDLSELSSRYDELNKLYRQAQERFSDVRQLRLELTEKTDSVLERAQTTEAQLELGQSRLVVLKEELLAKKSRLESLEELSRNFEGYQEGAKEVLRRKQVGEAESVLASVADIIDTSPQYEGAVSAVLGERLQYIIVQNYEAGLSLSEALKTTDTGRSSFVPVALPVEFTSASENNSSVLAARNSSDLGLPGLQGYLSDFVSIKPEFESLKKFFFGDVLIAESLRDAVGAWEKLHQTVVTLDGEVVSQDGVLTGGSLRHTSKSLLEKKREVRELTVLVQDLVTEVGEKERECLEQTRKLQGLRAELENLKSSGHAEDVKLVMQEKDLEYIHSEMERLNERRGQVTQQIFTSAQSLELFSTQIQELTAEELEKRPRFDSAHNIVESLRVQEESIKTELATLSQELTRIKVARAQSAERRAHLQNEIDRLSEETVRLRMAVVESQEQAALLARQQIESVRKAQFEEKRIGRILSERDAASAAHADAKNSYDAKLQEMQERELKVRVMRREHDTVKERLSQASIALTELRGGMSRIAEQFGERHQLILSEVYREYLQVADDFSFEESKSRAEELRLRLGRLGPVNIAAIEEFEEMTKRFDFLTQQKTDLEESLKKLQEVIDKINFATQERFKTTFDQISEKFSAIFPRLFKGGRGELRLTNPENLLETGVEIIAQPPGKKMQSITLLSGGEKALTALVLLFSIFLIKPSPFCLLDEVDAPLDDVNVDRYASIIEEMSARTQFVMITHNKRTMQIARAMFGVTMQEPGCSQIVSVEMGSNAA